MRKPARILATGLAGFVGGHLRVALGRMLPDARLLAFEGDITDRAAVAAQVADHRPDVCIHLAAIAAIGAAGAQPERAWHVNLGGTLAIAEALTRAAPDCALIHISSADIYGRSFASGAALDEAALPAPANVYGATKAAADLALGAWEGLHIIRLRPFNHTGPGQSPDFAIPAFARQIALIEAGKQPPILRTGNLDAARDFLDVRDIADAYARATAQAHSLPNRLILNLASGTPRRIGAVLETLLSLSQASIEIEPDPARMRPSDIPRAIGDAARARDLLGWMPHVPWQQTLTDVLDDWRQRAIRALP